MVELSTVRLCSHNDPGLVAGRQLGSSSCATQNPAKHRHVPPQIVFRAIKAANRSPVVGFGRLACLWLPLS
jgi:hypothetical protein